jgi:hypothetical protein
MNKSKIGNTQNLNCAHTKAKCKACGFVGCIYGGCKNEIYWWDQSKMLDYPSGCKKCHKKNTIEIVD